MQLYSEKLINMTNALIINSNRKALLIHNIKNGSDRWEFPGGKRKRGEDLVKCVCREFQEELGVKIETRGVFGDYKTQTPEGEFSCRTYNAYIIGGRPKIMEPKKHNEFKFLGYWDVEVLKDMEVLVPNLVVMMPRLKEMLNY
jgi:8-oxo-dGTP pyrophosphatase MutT (NUDIX family)